VTVTDNDLVAQSFEAHRDRLRALSLRLLGSRHDADEAVQEAWLRLSRTDPDSVDNLGGWLTTVVGRICLDMLRSRATKPELPTEEPPEPRTVPFPPASSPEDEALLADSLGLALLVVLDTLSPAERLAFVLHDMFAVPFEEIAPIVGRTPTAARKLASRARRRVQSDPAVPTPPPRPSGRSSPRSSPPPATGISPRCCASRGADAVMRVFAGWAAAARLATVEGSAGAVWAPGGRPAVAFSFVVRGGQVAAIELLADPETLAELELEL
jgi:RNA polymerase sigma factor (sigma-70 family)